MINLHDRVYALSEQLHARDRELAKAKYELAEAVALLAQYGRDNNVLCDERFALEKELADLRAEILELRGEVAA